jgi:hypothetical protein
MPGGKRNLGRGSYPSCRGEEGQSAAMADLQVYARSGEQFGPLPCPTLLGSPADSSTASQRRSPTRTSAHPRLGRPDGRAAASLLPFLSAHGNGGSRYARRVARTGRRRCFMWSTGVGPRAWVVGRGPSFARSVCAPRHGSRASCYRSQGDRPPGPSCQRNREAQLEHPIPQTNGSRAAVRPVQCGRAGSGELGRAGENVNWARLGTAVHLG